MREIFRQYREAQVASNKRKIKTGARVAVFWPSEGSVFTGTVKTIKDLKGAAVDKAYGLTKLVKIKFDVGDTVEVDPALIIEVVGKGVTEEGETALAAYLGEGKKAAKGGKKGKAAEEEEEETEDEEESEEADEEEEEETEDEDEDESEEDEEESEDEDEEESEDDDEEDDEDEVEDEEEEEEEEEEAPKKGRGGKKAAPKKAAKGRRK